MSRAVWLLVCVALFTTTALAEPPKSIDDALAVQETLRQARESLQRNEPGKAVDLLEKNLLRANGDGTYHNLLKDAYRSYLITLQLTGKNETYEKYRKRLAELGGQVAAMPKPEVVRGKREDEPASEKSDSLAAAAAAFAKNNFPEADEHYEKAKAGGATLNIDQKKQWAYCKLDRVVVRINDQNKSYGRADLEKDIEAATALAEGDKKLVDFAAGLRKKLGASAPVASTEGWTIVAAGNFRVLHRGHADLADQVAKLAEEHRAGAFKKWGGTATDWKPTCDIYLHPTANDYAKATGQAPTAPGHSTISIKQGAVASRRMDLRADEPNLLGSVLPRETTHVVLGDLFPDVHLPRWCDIGMAVQSEPRAQFERYSKTLVTCRQRGQLIPLSELLKDDFPDASKITVFYVESVSVVEFLVNQKGPAAFVAFAREAGSLDSALQKHYRIRNVDELQERWLRANFSPR